MPPRVSATGRRAIVSAGTAQHDPFEQQPGDGIDGPRERGPLGIAQPPQHLPPLRIDERNGIGEPRPCGGALEVKLGEVGPRPADLVEPDGNPLLPRGGQRVDPPVGPVGQPIGPLGADKPSLAERRERDIDLPGVHAFTKRPKRIPHPSTQLRSFSCAKPAAHPRAATPGRREAANRNHRPTH
jgi:hypothetical protein